MAIKKYTSGAWVPITYHKYGTETETITSLPAQIIGDGQAITSCQISGNTVQDGTPTPEAPVDVVGCGAWDEVNQSFKLPFTVNDTEYTIYLGQVETTRMVKKLVLTGGDDENWNITNNSKVLYLAVSDSLKEQGTICYCTHYETVNNVSSADDVNDGECAFNSHLNWLYIKDNNYISAQGFKNYLAAQYAAGTPVTVWYVLATPETAVVNEPLHKIGNYADTVLATNIPTTGTPENFDVGTTLKPSEVQLTYHGWHEHADTKYTE